MKISKLACLSALIVMPFMSSVQGADVDLWDYWRQGFEKYEAAEKEFNRKDVDKALQLYRESQEIFLKIRKISPEWNKDVVTFRLSLCYRKISAIEAPRRQAAAEAKHQGEISRLTAEIETLKKQLRQTRIELIDARSAANRNALTEKQVKKLMAENAALEKKLAASEAAVAALKAEVRRVDKSAEYQQQLLKTRTEMERAQMEIQRLKKEIATMRERARKLQEQRNQAESKAFRLEMQTQELEAKKKEIEVLSGENKKIAEALRIATQRQRELEQQLAASKQENTALQARIKDIENGTVALPSGQKLREELAAEKQRTVALTAALEKAKQQTQLLTAELEKLRAENKKMVMELVKTTEALAKLRTEYTVLSRNLEEQKKVAETARVLAQENAVLKKNLEEIARKYESLRQTATASTSARVAELTTALNSARANIKDLEEKLRLAQERMKGSSSELQQTIARLEEEKATLQRSLAAAKQEAASIKTVLEKMVTEFNALKQEFAALQGADTPVGKALRQSVDSKATLEEKLAVVFKEIEVLSKENAKLRAQTAVLQKLEQEIKALRAKQGGASAAETAELNAKIRELNEKCRKLEASLAAAKEEARRRDAAVLAETEALKNSVALLKQQLVSAQNAEAAVRKKLELLQMEYADLEKKIAGTVSGDALKKAQAEAKKLQQELAALRAAKAEADTALRAAEERLKVQEARLQAYAKEINPNAKAQLQTLTATVAELQEAKIQYENLVRELRRKLETSTEDNRELRLANTALQTQVAELRVKPEEYLKKANDLLQKYIQMEALYKKAQAQVDALTERSKKAENEIARLNTELQAAQSQVARYRRELEDWGQLPQADVQDEIAKKNKAIDQLVREISELKREREMLNAELVLSKDHVLKYKKLAQDIEANLQITRTVVAKLKTILARHTSAEEVERIVTTQFQFKKGEFGPIASVPQVQRDVAGIAAAEKPQLTPEQKAAREKEFKAVMDAGLAAEKEKNYSDALIQYWRASDLDPDNGEVYRALARVYLAKRDFRNARDNYKIAVQRFKMKRDPAFEEQLLILAQEEADLPAAEAVRKKNGRDTSEGTAPEEEGEGMTPVPAGAPAGK
ncbi:MAG: hypothetical protein IJW05_04335 [Lentisphaeria bacterium]|nr:hypothetical protein [Lentisphaeria bacterium]